MNNPTRVMNDCDTIEEKIVEILHDVIEDTNVTSEYLMECGFPSNIITAVESISKNEGEEYELFIERVSLNQLARNVKIKDLIDNMDFSRIPPPTIKDDERQEKYKRALAYLKNINKM